MSLPLISKSSETPESARGGHSPASVNPGGLIPNMWQDLRVGLHGQALQGTGSEARYSLELHAQDEISILSRLTLALQAKDWRIQRHAGLCRNVSLREGAFANCRFLQLSSKTCLPVVSHILAHAKGSLPKQLKSPRIRESWRESRELRFGNWFALFDLRTLQHSGRNHV
jgi:hypothetical protein